MLNDQIILEELSNDAVSHCIVFVLFLALVSKNSVNILEQMFYQCSHTAVGQTVSLLPRCTIPDCDSHSMLELSLGRWKQSVFSFHLCPRLEDA